MLLFVLLQADSIFLWNNVYVYFRVDLQYSLSISLTLNTKDNIFLSFIKSYGRQVFPHEKEVKAILLTRRVCFPVVFLLVVNN